MKRVFIIVSIIFSLAFISSCKKDNKKEDDLIEDEINIYEGLEELPYFSYLKESNPLVTIKVKDIGEMKLELFPLVAKITVDNFINYILEDSYTNSDFHRIIEGFMIQGGIINNTKPPIVGEFSVNGVTNDLKHFRGVISMARTSVYNSATSQFFIVHKTSPHLDGGYASFGGLIAGFDVLDIIANKPTNFYDAPLINIVIESITVDLRGYILE